jgi:hypothetical protein
VQDQVAEYKIGVRIENGKRPIIGIIVRSLDYYYIDHRSANGLADIAERFGSSSVEWFNMLSDLNCLIESGADLRPLGDVYMESPWETVDSKAKTAVGAYFNLLRADLKVSMEGDQKSADFVLIAKDFFSSGAIAREDAVQAINHVNQLKSFAEGSGVAAAPDSFGMPLLDAINSAVMTLPTSGDRNDPQPLDCLGAALSSLLGYVNWATPTT